MDVLVTEVVQKDVPVYQEWIGTLSGFINAQIRPQVKGYLLTKNYNEGDVVQRRRSSSSRSTRASSRRSSTRRRATRHRRRRRWCRTQLDVDPLHAAGQGRRGQPAGARQRGAGQPANLAAVDSRQGAVEQARLNLGWTKVTSPIDGVSGIAIAQIGDLVEPATEADHRLAGRSDQGRSSRSASRATCATRARSRRSRRTTQRRKGALELILADGGVYPHRGTVSASIGREVDPRTGTLTIEALFPNPEQRPAPRRLRQGARRHRDPAERAGRPAGRRAELPGHVAGGGGRRRQQGRDPQRHDRAALRHGVGDHRRASRPASAWSPKGCRRCAAA